MAKKNTVKKPTAKKPTEKKVEEVAPVVEETQEATTTDEVTEEVEETEAEATEETTETETENEEEKATTEESKDETLDVKKGQMITVVVTAEKFGTYKKGDKIVMHESTARACINKKVVKAK